MTDQPTTVVNIRTDDYDVYIGRANRFKGLKKSIWANPFSIPKDGTREEVIEKYRAYLLNQPDLLIQLPELRGKRLGCWCFPEACHGDVLAELADMEVGYE